MLIPADLKRILAEWNGRPDLLGAWLDLVLAGPRQWTEGDLVQRWCTPWSAKESRAWIAQALDAGLLLSDDGGTTYSVARPEMDDFSEQRTTEHGSTPGPGPKTARIDPQAFAETLAAHLVERVPALKAFDTLNDMLAKVRDSGERVEFDFEEPLPLDELEHAYVLWVLERVGRNRTKAAEVLGIDPSTLYRKLNRWESP